MTQQLEKDLYRAFECLSRGVISRFQGESRPSEIPDNYAGIHAAAKLLYRVAQLPPLQCEILQAKYGLVSHSMQAMAAVIQEHTGVPDKAAQGWLLAWLKHPQRPRVHQLADLMDVAEITVKKRSRKLYLYLDELNRTALANLQISLDGR